MISSILIISLLCIVVYQWIQINHFKFLAAEAKVYVCLWISELNEIDCGTDEAKKYDVDRQIKAGQSLFAKLPEKKWTEKELWG